MKPVPGSSENAAPELVESMRKLAVDVVESIKSTQAVNPIESGIKTVDAIKSTDTIQSIIQEGIGNVQLIQAAETCQSVAETGQSSIP